VLGLLDELGVPGSEMSDFRLLLLSLKEFMRRNEGAAPLPGNIPDMTATSESFIQLQQRYHNKAEADRQEFRDIAGTLSTQVGRAPMEPGYVDQFCKSVYAVGFMDCLCPIAAEGGVSSEVRHSQQQTSKTYLKSQFKILLC
jgi:hypothetical protein